MAHGNLQVVVNSQTPILIRDLQIVLNKFIVTRLAFSMGVNFGQLAGILTTPRSESPVDR